MTGEVREMSAPENPRFLPKGAERCVWMAAGMVAYKLCDRVFDCESCPFDAVMRGQAPAAPGDALLAPVPAIGPDEFREDRRYHAAHTWAQAVGPDRLRIGLDAFAAWLVGDATSIVLPPAATLVAAGRAGAWLIDGCGPLPLRMPVDGTVIRGNPLLRTHPRLAIEAPYDAGWLIEARVADPAAALAGLLSASRMRERAARELGEFDAQARARLSRGAEEVGVTLADGGERIADLRRLLGAEQARSLIERFLAG
jgi:glycine cleavage system H protein